MNDDELETILAALQAAERRLEDVRLDVTRVGLNAAGVELDGVLAQLAEVQRRLRRLRETGAGT
jgi:hypothetical protein